MAFVLDGGYRSRRSKNYCLLDGKYVLCNEYRSMAFVLDGGIAQGE